MSDGPKNGEAARPRRQRKHHIYADASHEDVPHAPPHNAEQHEAAHQAHHVSHHTHHAHVHHAVVESPAAGPSSLGDRFKQWFVQKQRSEKQPLRLVQQKGMTYPVAETTATAETNAATTPASVLSVPGKARAQRAFAVSQKHTLRQKRTPKAVSIPVKVGPTSEDVEMTQAQTKQTPAQKPVETAKVASKEDAKPVPTPEPKPDTEKTLGSAPVQTSGNSSAPKLSALARKLAAKLKPVKHATPHTPKPAPVVPQETTDEKKIAQPEPTSAQKEIPATSAPVNAPVGKPSLFQKLFKPAPKAPGKTSEEIEENLVRIRAEKEKKKRHKLKRQSLQQYLDKAGYEINADRLKRNIFRGLIVFFLLVTCIILSLASSYGAQAGSTLLFIVGLWTAVFAAALLVVYASIYFFLDYRIYTRTKEMEEVLPDFLQLASSNIAAGMPIDRALWYAIRPNFGVLAKEMEEVAKATMAGEDLETSLVRFADKYESVTLRRSVSILIEGMHSGGEMADLLNKIALNIDEMRIMKKEMAASVTTYAIFITFASIIIAPFLFALATELLTIIVKITSSLDLGSASNTMITIGKPDPDAVQNFTTFSVMMLIVSTVFSASIVSVIRRGNVIEGVKSIPVYALVAVVIYYIASSALHGLFAGII